MFPSLRFRITLGFVFMLMTIVAMTTENCCVLCVSCSMILSAGEHKYNLIVVVMYTFIINTYPKCGVLYIYFRRRWHNFYRKQSIVITQNSFFVLKILQIKKENQENIKKHRHGNYLYFRLYSNRKVFSLVL